MIQEKSIESGIKEDPDLFGKSTFSRPSANTSKMGRPTNQSQSEAITLKDIFFIDDPKCEKVPRRAEQEFYYEEELIACAVQLKQSMTPEQVKEKIGKSFERSCGFCPPFEYIKAVGDKLVSPTNIIVQTPKLQY